MFSTTFLSRNAVREAALAGMTTMRVGGLATMVTLESRADLAEVLDQPHRWLGKGANLLVGDEGVAEPVVKLGRSFATLSIGPVHGGRATVAVGAAVDLVELVAACVKAGLAGPEGLSGIPATVGGALRMNAGTPTCWMFQWVSRVEVVPPGARTPRWLKRGEVAAAYRTSGLPTGTLFLGCEFDLATGDPAQLRAAATALKQAKAKVQPLAQPSAGCVFKNPCPDLPAGLLIDELGFKGRRVGGALVSPVHANFIVNPERKATAADVCQLIAKIRDRAWRERGVVLELEVESWQCPDFIHQHPQDAQQEAQV